MMTHKLAKELKKVGFPQKHKYNGVVYDIKKGYQFTINDSDDYDSTGKQPFNENKSSGLEDRYIYIPALEEIIDECGDRFIGVQINPFPRKEKWCASAITKDGGINQFGNTALEAVAKLFIRLNK